MVAAKWMPVLICLSGLLAPVAILAAEPKAGEQVEAATTVKTTVEGKTEETELRYWLYLPESYKDQDKQAWPLVLFLHGAGERGDDLAAVKKHGPPKLVDGKKHFPFILVSPQCPKEQRWNAAQLAKLVEHLTNTLQVDGQRRYVTGLSMGGAGSWSLLAEHPGLFAAGVPICGRGDVAAAEKLAKTPIWAFVGAKDRVELVDGNKQLAAAIEKAGGKQIKLTIYPDAAHDSWTETYDNAEVYEWLLKQRGQ